MAELPDPVKELGWLPDSDELERLTRNYPTYEWNHRSKLLNGFFAGKSLDELLEDKLQAKKITGPISKQSKGGHTRWVIEKARKTIIRLLYLRYRNEEDMDREEANKKLLLLYPSSKAKDHGQSNIRKRTQGATMDNQSV